MSTAASFVAVDKSYLSVASNASLQAGDIAFEIGGWVYLTSKATDCPIVSKFTSGNFEYLLRYAASTDRFRFTVSSDGSTAPYVVDSDAFGALTLNTWYFVRAWHDPDANLLRISVNNGTVNSLSISSGIYVGAAPFRIGTYDTAGTLVFGSARLAGLYIRKQISTTDEAALLYNSGKMRPWAQWPTSLRANVVGHWSLGEGPHSATQQALDDSGNANHLTFTASAIIDATTLNGGFESVTAGTEALSNTGFETAGTGGDDVFQNWVEAKSDGTIERSNVGPHSGTYHCKMTTGATGNAVSVELERAVVGGSANRLSFWTCGDGTNAGRVQVRDATNGYANIIAIQSTGVTSATYTLVTLEFTAPATCVLVNVRFLAPSVAGGAYACFDDVSLKPLSPATWTKSESGTSKVQVEMAAPYAGTYALSCQLVSVVDYCEVRQSSLLTIGKQYGASCYAKADSTTGSPVGKIGSQSGGGQITFSHTTSYAAYSGTFTASHANFCVGAYSGDGRNQRFDNITLTAANLLTAAGPDLTTPIPVFMNHYRRMRAA